jgi:hypothetical protein
VKCLSKSKANIFADEFVFGEATAEPIGAGVGGEMNMQISLY